MIGDLNEYSKSLHEIFTDPIDLDMLEMDLSNFVHILDEWLKDEEPVDPDICRYMGMLFLSLAEKLESSES